jgi:DmsE family decaheme c-type cytochrome
MKRILLTLLWIAVPCLVIAAYAADADKSADPRNALVSEGAEYLGTTQCMMCHSDMKEPFLGTKHALSLGNPKLPPSVVGCEMCHGPGGLHMSNFTNDPGFRSIVDFKSNQSTSFTEICLSCHASISTKNEYRDNRHAESKVYCADCHNPHANEHKFALLRKPPNELCASCHKAIAAKFEGGLSKHPLKGGAFFCVDCHNPHGASEGLLVRGDISKTCGGCHEYTRQAYAFPHISEFTDPTGDVCLNCHDQHASSAPNLLKFQGRTLCLRCHTDRISHVTGKTCWAAGCHSQIHGSNENPMFVK